MHVYITSQNACSPLNSIIISSCSYNIILKYDLSITIDITEYLCVVYYIYICC